MSQEHKHFTVYDPSTGQILGCGMGPELIPNSIWGQYSGVDYWIDSKTKKAKQIPVSPGSGFEWSWESKLWLPNVELITKFYRNQLEQLFNQYDLAPIEFNSFWFDADAVARERITGVLNRLNRGDGLPEGWLGWRDYNNNMLWVSESSYTVQHNLSGLSSAIEDRSQRLLSVAWAHKVNLEVIDSIEDLQNYDVTTLWEE